MAYYAVVRGFHPGIYTSWSMCQKEVSGFSGAVYKKFTKKTEAEIFIGLKSNPSLEDEVSEMGFILDDEITEDPTVSLPSSSPLSLPSSLPSSLPLSLPSLPLPSSRSQLTDLVSPEISHDCVTIFTDGACKMYRDGTRQAGFGFWIPLLNKRVSQPLVGNPYTNNRAELSAIITAISYFPPEQPIHIVTDSRYSILLFTGTAHKYQKDNYRNKEGRYVPNHCLVQNVVGLLSQYRLKFTHINSHTGKTDQFSLGNEIADQLAVIGAKQSTRMKPTIPLH